MPPKMKGPSIPRNKPYSQAANVRPELSSRGYSHEFCTSCGHRYKHGTPIQPGIAEKSWEVFHCEINEHYKSCPKSLSRMVPPASAIRDTIIAEATIQQLSLTGSSATFPRHPPNHSNRVRCTPQRSKLSQLQSDDIVQGPLSVRPAEDSTQVPHTSDTHVLPEDTISRPRDIHGSDAQPPSRKFKKNVMDWKVRKAALEADPLLDAVEQKRVHCRLCDKWIRLDSRNDFYPGLWRKHREHHKDSDLSKGGSNRNDEGHVPEDAAQQPARKRRAVEGTHPKNPKGKSMA